MGNLSDNEIWKLGYELAALRRTVEEAASRLNAPGPHRDGTNPHGGLAASQIMDEVAARLTARLEELKTPVPDANRL